MRESLLDSFARIAQIIEKEGNFVPRDEYLEFLRRIQDHCTELKEASRQPPTDLKE